MTRTATTRVTATRLDLVDLRRNTDKFYDVAVVGTSVICHFGRNSVGVGQWTKAETHPTVGEAERAAADRLAAKRAKGYATVGHFASDLDGDVAATDLRVKSAVSVSLNRATYSWKG